MKMFYRTEFSAIFRIKAVSCADVGNKINKVVNVNRRYSIQTVDGLTD